MPTNSAEYQRRYRLRLAHPKHITPVTDCPLCEEQPADRAPAPAATKAQPMWEPGHQHSFKQTGATWPGSTLPEVQCRECGWKGPKGSNTYTDGLPDWPQLIQGLTTKQQNELLEKFPRTPGRTPS